MITQDEQEQVIKYLKSLEISQMEFFEELNDHIITSYEQRISKKQSISEHIRDVVQPSFGGVKGIVRIMRGQNKLRRQLVRDRAKALFEEYLFGWPSIMVTVLITLLVFSLNNFLGSENTFLLCLIVGAAFPAGVSFYAQTKFYYQCKTHGLPYRSSNANNQIAFFSYFGIWAINILFNFTWIFFLRKSDKVFELITTNTWLLIPISTLYILYGLICLRLFKENFQFKLVHQSL